MLRIPVQFFLVWFGSVGFGLTKNSIRCKMTGNIEFVIELTCVCVFNFILCVSKHACSLLLLFSSHYFPQQHKFMCGVAFSCTWNFAMCEILKLKFSNVNILWIVNNAWNGGDRNFRGVCILYVILFFSCFIWLLLVMYTTQFNAMQCNAYVCDRRATII